MIQSGVFETFLFTRRPLLASKKITIDPHIFAHVNMGCPDDRHSRLKIYLSEMILDSYEYTTGGYVKMQCMVKVKFALEEATKAQRGSRGIALLFL